MDRMIACCGIDCGQCHTYQATLKDDDAARAEVAAEWSKMYKARLKAEDINCDGCTSESERLFAHCSVCGIRSCALGRGFETCAECGEYACEKLEQIFKYDPKTKATLDMIRGNARS